MTITESLPFNLRLLRARQVRGLSRRQLGAVIGKSHTAVGLFEAGRLNPSVTLRVRLAQVLGDPELIT